MGGFKYVGSRVDLWQLYGNPAVGFHYAQWIELAYATGTTTWFTTNSSSFRQGGISRGDLAMSKFLFAVLFGFLLAPPGMGQFVT